MQFRSDCNSGSLLFIHQVSASEFSVLWCVLLSLQSSVNTNLEHEQRPDHVAPINYRPAVCARHQKNNTVRPAAARCRSQSVPAEFMHIATRLHGHTCVGTRVIKKIKHKMLNNRFTFPKCGWAFKCAVLCAGVRSRHLYILCERVAHFLALALINSQQSPNPLSNKRAQWGVGVT